MYKGSRIFLIGFMAAGKNTVGKLLAQNLGYEYIDTDRIIEKRQNMPIHEIFSKQGEAFFRKAENSLLREIIEEQSRKGAVISAGGGMPCSKRNLGRMKRHGIVVYLRSTPDDIIQRIGHSETRPVFHRLKSKGDLKKGIENMLKQREKYYTRASFVFDNTNSRDPQEVAEHIASRLKRVVDL